MALRKMRLAAIALLALPLGCGTSAPRASERAPVESPEAEVNPSAGPVTARLIADVSHVAPGQEFTLAVELDIDEGWFIHWKHPGDGGEPTRATPRVPEGFEPGEARYPGPERFDIDREEARYGYGEGVLLSFPVVAPDELGSGPIELAAEAEWLACRGGECRPGRAAPRLELAAATPETPSQPTHAARFASHRRRLPAALAEAGARTSWQRAGDGRAELIVDIPNAAELAFFPEGEIGLVGQAVTPSDTGKSLRLWLDTSARRPARGVIRMARGGDVNYLRLAGEIPDSSDLGGAPAGEAR